MTQRQREGLRFLHPQPPHPDDERALQRIYFERSEWDELNWFVQFGSEDINQLSPGELLSRKEELRAVERTLFRRMVSSGSISEPTDDEFRHFQGFVREKLTELADTGFVVFELPETIATISEHGWSQHFSGRGWLEHQLVHLLKHFIGQIQRCPYSECRRIFLRSRSNAAYCNRQCQNRAAMKTIRQRQREDRRLEDNINHTKKNKPKKAASAKSQKGRH